MDQVHGNTAVKLETVEERIRIDKVAVPAETVRVRTVVKEDMATAEATLIREDLDVHRVPVGRPVDEPPPVRTEGDTVIFPVLREEMVVRKQLTLVEEVHVTKRKTTHRATEPVMLRHTEAVVEHRPTTVGAEDDQGEEQS